MLQAGLSFEPIVSGPAVNETGEGSVCFPPIADVARRAYACGMRKMLGVVEAPRTHPVGVLLTHIPLVVLWVAFAVRDVADGSIKVRGKGPVTPAADPLLFYFFAAVIVAVSVVLSIRILQAGFALADKRST